MPGWMMLMGGNIVDIPSALTGLGGFGMLLGPEGTSSPLTLSGVVGVLVSSAPGTNLALIPAPPFRPWSVSWGVR